MYLDFSILGYAIVAVYFLIGTFFVAGGYTFYRLILSGPKALATTQGSLERDAAQERNASFAIPSQGGSKPGISKAA